MLNSNVTAYLCDTEEITCYLNGKRSGQRGYVNTYYADFNDKK